MTTDYYKLLEVDREASLDVIEAAYRRLAIRYHPDRNRSADATDRMQEINEAYAFSLPRSVWERSVRRFAPPGAERLLAFPRGAWERGNINIKEVNGVRMNHHTIIDLIGNDSPQEINPRTRGVGSFSVTVALWSHKP